MEAVFGWQFQDDGQGYYRITNRGATMAACCRWMRRMQEYYRPWWMVYFSVDDIDQAAALCVKLGGQLDFPPQPVPGAGRFVLFRDPQGRYCSLFQLNEPERWVE